jgi:hypothetical protein
VTSNGGLARPGCARCLLSRTHRLPPARVLAVASRAAWGVPPKAPPEVVAERIIAALAAGHTVVFPDDASAAAGSVHLSDPVKLEHMLAD